MPWLKALAKPYNAARNNIGILANKCSRHGVEDTKRRRILRPVIQ